MKPNSVYFVLGRKDFINILTSVSWYNSSIEMDLEKYPTDCDFVRWASEFSRLNKYIQKLYKFNPNQKSYKLYCSKRRLDLIETALSEYIHCLNSSNIYYSIMSSCNNTYMLISEVISRYDMQK